jgi:hypothetical protein
MRDKYLERTGKKTRSPPIRKQEELQPEPRESDSLGVGEGAAVADHAARLLWV